jgi:hypothetical protein
MYVGRSRLNTIPLTRLSNPTPSPPLLLPPRNLPHNPPRHLPPILLGPDPRLRRSRQALGNSTTTIPPGSSPRFRAPHPVPLSLRPLPHPRDTQAHKHRRTRRGARWKIRGYTARRCADELCEGAWGSVRCAVYVLFVEALVYRPAGSGVWRDVRGAVFYLHTEFDTAAAVLDRIFQGQEGK